MPVRVVVQYQFLMAAGGVPHMYLNLEPLGSNKLKPVKAVSKPAEAGMVMLDQNMIDDDSKKFTKTVTPPEMGTIHTFSESE